MTETDNSRLGGSTETAADVTLINVQSNVSAETGELLTTNFLPDSMALASDEGAATWLIYRGLHGRYAYSASGWVRLGRRGWEPVKLATVRAQARRAFAALYDRRIEAGASGADEALLRVLDVNWCWRLVERMRTVARLDSEARQVGA